MLAFSPFDLIFRELFFQLDDFMEAMRVYVKLEGFHITGSIKIKPALALIRDLEERGLARAGETTIIESSSGNMGIALSLVCSLRGYRFICVTDPNITELNVQGIRAYGGEVVIVTERDANGGYVATRLAEIKRRVEQDPRTIWINQYANPANKHVHAEETVQEILAEFPVLDWLFIGTGTTGTFMGCVEYLREHSPRTRVVAVEPVGSVTFGQYKSARRRIPGIGASRRPELADLSLAHEVVYVDEPRTIRTCRELVKRYGLLLGGSSGTVLAAVRELSDKLLPQDVIVAISPDLGDKYLDTIYNDQWVLENYGNIISEQNGLKEEHNVSFTSTTHRRQECPSQSFT